MPVTRFALAALAVLLAGCEKAPERPDSPPPATGAVPAEGSSGSAFLDRYDDTMPDWLQIARTREGSFVQYRPKGILREGAEIQAQVRILHREPQTWTSDDGGVEVIYARELLTYRFRCADRTFALTERAFLGAGDSVTQAVKYPVTSEADWRPISQGGPAAVLEGPVCRTGR